MTKNQSTQVEKRFRRLMENQERLRREKEALIALCLVLATVLGLTLILF